MSVSRDIDQRVEALASGDRRQVARLISLVEDGSPEASEVLRRLYPRTGHASTLGVTGSPGAGKSTLVDGLVSIIRAEGRTVGVIAVDPTSPFTGGALLGDRVRMQSHALDPGVFIRSMATRGHLGGLSLAAPEAMRVLEAAGYEIVVVETVGVGQSEVAVARATDTTVVVLAPGMGDAIQAAKAGILEVADVYCVNKADKPGARDTVRDLRNMLEMGMPHDPDWMPPIVSASAATGAGLDELWAKVNEHQAYLRETGKIGTRRRERLGAEVREIVGERLKSRLERTIGQDEFERMIADVAERRLDPYTAADELVTKLGLRRS